MRPDILRLVCANLPEAEAALIRQLPQDEFGTHLEAYLAVRRSKAPVPPEISVPWLEAMSRCIDAGHHKNAFNLIDTEPADGAAV